MKKVLSGQKIRVLDQETIKSYGLSEEVLIERAALAFYEELKRDITEKDTIFIFCGCGNNGADGMALGRILSLKSYKVKIFMQNHEDRNINLSSGAALEKNILEKYNISMYDSPEQGEKCDIIIDAILGTGINRQLSQDIISTIELINEYKNNDDVVVYSMDIPTGVSSDDGKIFGQAVHADKTITFGYYKIGNILYPGRDYCGKVIVKDSGIYDFDEKKDRYVLDDSDMSKMPFRMPSGHKGTFGKVLVISGSTGMAGAAFLCSEACYYAGAGLVRIYTHEDNRNILQTQIPEAIVQCYSRYMESELISLINDSDLIVCGPGLGVNKDSEKIVQCVLKNASVPVVLDADALNIIAENTEILRLPHPELILTPHPGEMARLLDSSVPYVLDNTLRIAEEFSRDYNVVLVLKGACTITAIPYGNTYLNTTGNNGMATGGSGDVLSGYIAGMLVQDKTNDFLIPLSVYRHGKACERASEKYSKYSMTSRDLLNELKEI
jgi:hydroxyethylthiazole kinase-like uncharacterized protein yjeF